MGSVGLILSLTYGVREEIQKNNDAVRKNTITRIIDNNDEALLSRELKRYEKKKKTFCPNPADTTFSIHDMNKLLRKLILKTPSVQETSAVLPTLAPDRRDEYENNFRIKRRMLNHLLSAGIACEDALPDEYIYFYLAFKKNAVSNQGYLTSLRRIAAYKKLSDVFWKDKKNLLHCAISYQIPFSQIRFLIEAGVDVNGQDKEGNTPLHYVAIFHRAYPNHADILAISQLLCAAGADHVIGNVKRQTPLVLGKTAHGLRPEMEMAKLLQDPAGYSDRHPIKLYLDEHLMTRSEEAEYKPNPVFLDQNIVTFAHNRQIGQGTRQR